MKISKCLRFVAAVLPLLFAVRVVQADPISYAPTFTCVYCPGAAAPTAPNVSFGSPTLDITFGNFTVPITLNSTDAASDTYDWSATLIAVNTGQFSITDSTDGITDYSGTIFPTANNGYGALSFSSPVPEPGSFLLMLSGIVGILLVTGKRIAHSLPRRA